MPLVLTSRFLVIRRLASSTELANSRHVCSGAAFEVSSSFYMHMKNRHECQIKNYTTVIQLINVMSILIACPYEVTIFIWHFWLSVRLSSACIGQTDELTVLTIKRFTPNRRYKSPAGDLVRVLSAPLRVETTSPADKEKWQSISCLQSFCLHLVSKGPIFNLL